jgi:hypothetical protein
MFRHCSYACSACSVAAACAAWSCCCAHAMAAGEPSGHPSIGTFCSHTLVVVVVVGGTVVVVVVVGGTVVVVVVDLGGRSALTE